MHLGGSKRIRLSIAKRRPDLFRTLKNQYYTGNYRGKLISGRLPNKKRRSGTHKMYKNASPSRKKLKITKKNCIKVSCFTRKIAFGAPAIKLQKRQSIVICDALTNFSDQLVFHVLRIPRVLQCFSTKKTRGGRVSRLVLHAFLRLF